MIDVHIPEPIRHVVGGAEVLRVPVETPRQALRGLLARFPGLREAIEALDWRLLVDGRPVGPGRRLDPGATLELEAIFGGGGTIIGGAIKGIVGAVGGAQLLQFAALATLTGISAGIARRNAPSPLPDYMGQEDPSDRTSFLFGRTGNLQQEGHPIPIVYGDTRAGALVASQATLVRDMTEEDANGVRQLRSESWFRAVDIISEGEIFGLATDNPAFPATSAIYFDGLPVAETDGSLNVEGVVWEQRLGEDPSPSPIDVPFVEREIGVDGHITKGWATPPRQAGSVERVVNDLSVNFVRITTFHPALWVLAAGVPSTHRVELGVEVADYLGAYTAVTYSLSDFYLAQFLPGTVLGLTSPYPATPESDVTAIKESGWQVALVAGPSSITVNWYYEPTGVPASRVTVPLTANFVPKEDCPFQYTGTWAGAYFWEVEVPIVTSGNYTTGSDQPAGLFHWSQWLRIPRIVVDGLTLTPYERSSLVDLSKHGTGPWTIRVYRVTADETNPANSASDTYWSRYAEVYEASLDYDQKALVSIEASAEATGGRIPQRSYRTKGRLCAVPYLYDYSLSDPWLNVDATWPIPSGGNPVWDTARQWTANNALCLNDLLTFQWGVGLDQSQVDLFGLADAAIYCDELVDAGTLTPTTEHRFEFDHQFLTESSALQAVVAMASSMNAKVWWGQGQVFISQDRPTDPTRLFGPENVIDGAFSYASVSRSGHYSSAVVSYRDRARGWVNATDRETRLWMIDRYGDNELEQRVIGITRWSAARRRNRYVLEMGLSADQIVTFATGAEGMALAPGQVIQISDSAWEPIRATGRTTNQVRSPGATEIFLDLEFSFDIALTYTIHVMDLQATMQSYDVVNPGTTTSTVEIAAPGLINGLGGHHVWIITEATELATRLYRVMQVDEEDLLRFGVKASLYDPGVYDRIEDLDEVDPGWPYEI